jgi:hypothetical protein
MATGARLSTLEGVRFGTAVEHAESAMDKAMSFFMPVLSTTVKKLLSFLMAYT